MTRNKALHSSLKTPGSQTRSKSVRFADCIGKSLEMVRYVTRVNSADNQLQKPGTSMDSDVRIRLFSMNSKGPLINGTIYTVNPRYFNRSSEQVYLSISMDNWESCQKIQAYRLQCLSNLISKWCFSGQLNCGESGGQCVFKLIYHYDNRIVEDTNKGQYYRIYLVPCKCIFDNIHRAIVSDLLTLEQILIC